MCTCSIEVVIMEIMNEQKRTYSLNMVSDASVNGSKDLVPVSMVKLGSSYIIPPQELDKKTCGPFPALNGASILKTVLDNSRGSSPQSTSSSSSNLESTNFVNITNGSSVNGDLKFTVNGVKKLSPSRRSSASSISSSDADIPGSPSSKKRKLMVPASQDLISSSPNSSAPYTADQSEKPDKRKRCGTCNPCQVPKCGKCFPCSSNKEQWCIERPKCEVKLHENTTPNNVSPIKTPNNLSPTAIPDNLLPITTPNNLSPINITHNNLSQMTIPDNLLPITTPNNVLPITTTNNSSTITAPINSLPITTPDYTDKRKRCGVCSTCKIPTCGKCSFCLKGDAYCPKRPKCEKRPQHNLNGTSEITSLSSPSTPKLPKRKRCKTCPGCIAPHCGECAICKKKAIAEAKGEKLGYGICRQRKCHAMIQASPTKTRGKLPASNDSPAQTSSLINETAFSPVKKFKIKHKRCGKCKGCIAEPCGNCGHCAGYHPLKCFQRRCKAPIGEARSLSPEKPLRCGACFGCSATECGTCAFCLKKAEAGEEMPSGICDRKVCGGIKNRELSPQKVLKKRRCKICPACMASECGECSFCKKKASLEPGVKMSGGICIKRKCENMIGGAEPLLKPLKKKKLKPSKPKAINFRQKGTSNKAVQRTARCGLCPPCIAPDCGKCTSCKVNEFAESPLGKIQCLTNKCNNPIAVTGNGGRLSVATPEAYVPQVLCEDCPGCSSECSRCPACLGNPKFGGMDDPPQKCQERICHNVRQKRKNPPKVSSRKPLMRRMMEMQDDSAGGTTMPTRVVNGVLYDFRCFICKALPRAGSANRSELMRHYALYHFSEDIKNEFPNLKKCPHCNVDFKGKGSYVSHMGQKHNEVVKYLPEEAKKLCPLEIQGKSHGRRPRRMAVVKKRRKLGGIVEWPDLPDGFHPAAENRLYDPKIAEEPVKRGVIMKEITVIRINGKEIEDWMEEEEDCVLTIEGNKIPDYTGVEGQCMACIALIAEVPRLVLHLHQDHQIEGGSSHLMKDAQAFIEKGFIRLNKADKKRKYCYKRRVCDTFSQICG